MCLCNKLLFLSVNLSNILCSLVNFLTVGMRAILASKECFFLLPRVCFGLLNEGDMVCCTDALDLDREKNDFVVSMVLLWQCLIVDISAYEGTGSI